MNTNMNFFEKIISFLKDVKVELKKVSWPSRKEATKYTIIVIIISIVTAAFLGGIDYLFAVLIEKFIM
jgi:preprotein translocase subunit SecE